MHISDGNRDTAGTEYALEGHFNPSITSPQWNMKTIPYFAEVRMGAAFGSQLELSCQQGPAAAAPVGSSMT